jgi:6-hydroxytryprostatin B O-methyltransferase
MSMTNGLFKEYPGNMLGHTPLSAHFATSPLHLETVLFQAQMKTPIAMKMTDMTCKYNGSDKTTETAYYIAMATDLPFFSYLSENPVIAAQLEAGIKFLGGTDETHIRHLLEVFNWEALGEAEVVDVSRVCKGLVCERPHIHGILN